MMQGNYVVFEDLFKQIVLDPIAAIRITDEDGNAIPDTEYENDVTLLEGWLTHYAADLEKGLRGKSFPAIAAHSRNELIVTQNPANRGDPVAAQNTRGVTLECAVSAKDPEQINSNLESLLRDVKRALAPFRNKLTIRTVDFILPEGSNRYAFMQIELDVVYNEQWN